MKNFKLNLIKNGVSKIDYLEVLDKAEYPKPINAEVRKIARLLAQGKRCESSLLRFIPRELQIKTATFLGDPTVHDEQDLEKFASDHLCGPKA